MESQLPQSRWATLHVSGLYSNTLTGVQLVTGNIYNPQVMILDAIDLVDFDLLENNRCLLAVGDTSTNGPYTYFFQAFTYASSQGIYSWRGQMPLNGTTGLYMEPTLGAWSLSFHALLVPQTAAIQITQYP